MPNLTCPISYSYANHPAFLALAIATPFVCLPCFTAAVLLMRSMRRRFRNHSRPNALVLSAAVAAAMANGGLLIGSARQTFRGVYSPCRLAVSSRLCQFALTPVTVGVGVFNLSLICLVIERALLVKRVLIESRRSSPLSMTDSGWSGRYRTGLLLLSLWGGIGGMAAIRVGYSDPNDSVPVCAITSFRAMLIVLTSVTVLVIGNLASLFLAVWTLKVSKTQLNNFASAQNHISLNSRVNLRYTLTLAEVLYPSLVFGSVWQFLADVAFFAILVIFHLQDDVEKQPHLLALTQHFQALFLMLPPTFFFSVVAIYRKERFEKQGDSLFVRISALRQDGEASQTTDVGDGRPVKKTSTSSSVTRPGSKEKGPGPSQGAGERRLTHSGLSLEAALRFQNLQTAWHSTASISPVAAAPTPNLPPPSSASSSISSSSVVVARRLLARLPPLGRAR